MSVIKCGFEIEITDDKAFIEKVAKYMETEPELVTYDNISNFIEDSIFNDFSYGSGEKSHQIRTDNQIADVARVRGIETDGGFYTSIDCDEIVEVVDKMYDEKQRGLTDGEFAKSVFDMLSKDDYKYLKDYQDTNVTFLEVQDFEKSETSFQFGGDSWQNSQAGLSDFCNSYFAKNSDKQYVYDLEIKQEGIAENWHISVDMNDKRNDYHITLVNDYIGKHIDLSTASALKELGLSQESLNMTGFINNVQSILSQAIYDVPSFDYIEKNTLYVAKFDNGDRRVGTKEALAWVRNDPNLDEIGEASWTAQPQDLQRFYKAFDRAWKEGMYAYGEFKSFYDSWVKNPEKYEPQTREVIGKLSDELAKLSVYDDLIIKNYDGQGAGNHRVGNFVEALAEIGTDFDVVEIKPKEPKNQYSYTEITVQTDDDKAFQRYDYEANRKAIKHDKYMGDGKYESIQTLSKKDVIKKDIEQQRLQKGKE